MPELPEVEVLVRHLSPLLVGMTVEEVQVKRAKVLAPTSIHELGCKLQGATFVGLLRRGKYLVFELQGRPGNNPFTLLGHLGMTGRMYLQAVEAPLPKHAAVILRCGAQNLVFEDTRYFGRFTLDTTVLEKLGPEPLSAGFTTAVFGKALSRSSQAIKVKLLDQRLVAGLGNIYASEALFRAGVSPVIPARCLGPEQVARLWRALRSVLRQAIARGSTVPLRYAGEGRGDGLFYFGRSGETPASYEERLRVYDREGSPCPRCGAGIERFVQAARSTFFCPKCQSARRKRRAVRVGSRKNGRRKMAEERRTA
jgi:formamidopyrimidine-DNA glycosylase